MRRKECEGNDKDMQLAVECERCQPPTQHIECLVDRFKIGTRAASERDPTNET